MIIESLLTLVPAAAAIGLAVAVVVAGYAAVSCVAKQMKGGECSPCA